MCLWGQTRLLFTLPYIVSPHPPTPPPTRHDRSSEKCWTLASNSRFKVVFLGFFNEGESFDDGEATSSLYRAMAHELRRQVLGSGCERCVGGTAGARDS